MEPPPSTRVFSVSEVIIQAEESCSASETTPCTSEKSSTQTTNDKSGIIACFTFCPKDGLVPVDVQNHQESTIHGSRNEAATMEDDCVDITFECCDVTKTTDSYNRNKLGQVESTQGDPLNPSKCEQKQVTSKVQKSSLSCHLYEEPTCSTIGPGESLERTRNHLSCNDQELPGSVAELCQSTLVECEQDDVLNDLNSNRAKRSSARMRNRQPTQKMSEYICRLCEQISYKVIKIFGSQGNQLKLADKIHFHLPIKVKPQDRLPLGVCATCVNALNVCDDLYQKSLDTDHHLRQIFPTEQQTKLQTLSELFSNKQGKDQIIADIRRALLTKERSDEILQIGVPFSDVVLQNKGMKISRTYNASTLKSDNKAVTNVLTAITGNQSEDHLISNGNSNEADAVMEDSVDNFDDYEEQRDEEKENPKEETCYICQEICSSHAEFLKHRKTHLPEDRLKCPDCGKMMPNDHSFATHRKIHLGIMYPCHICGKALASSSGLRAHLLVHEDPKFCCQICGKTFRTSYKLQSHMVMHSDNRPFSCTKCGQLFKTKVTLKQHSLIHAEKRMFICDICGHAVNRQSHLRLHMNSHRDGDRPFSRKHPCDHCTLEFKNRFSLMRHMVAVHDAEAPPPPPTPSGESLCDWLCAVCGNQCESKKAFLRHKIICRKTHQCQVCARVLTSRRSLKNHMLGHTGEKPFPCNFCGECFKSVVSKEIHERVHTGERPFSCNRCDKTFRSVTNLYQHKATHDAPRKYSCNYCPYKSHRPASLRVHLRVHTGEKPYSCTICGKSYKASWDLKLHSESHTSLGSRRSRKRQKPISKAQMVVQAVSVSEESSDTSSLEATGIILHAEDM